MQYCNQCGAENSDAARFCSGCGKPIAFGVSPATLALQSLLHNQYLVLKLLGQGGMGSVYLAQDQGVFNRLCVVKEMLPYFTTPVERQQAEQNFEREARLLASLRNSRIPQVYAYFVENNHYYLVMEWVEGDNLEVRLASQRGPLPEPDVLDYAIQLANILVYIAKQNPPVIHRDIKPANIIVGDDGQVKLVDFGIAKATMSSGQSSKVSMPLGTQGFAPPEQYSGQVEPRTDVYALGATLHHLLTGRDPRNESPFQFPPVRSLAPGVSPELEKLLAEMLQLDPTLRPTAVELRTRLEALLTPQAVGGSQFQPFVFRAGAIAANLHELAQACDKYWDEAVEHLYNGDFEPWLAQINRPDLAVRAGSIKRSTGNRSAGLEEFIRAIDHTIMMPALAVDQNTVDLGTVERGERRSFTVRLMNAGRGYLHGEIKNSAPWVRVTPRNFGLHEGQQEPLTITIDTAALNEGPISQPILEATSNGGLAVMAIKLVITWHPRVVWTLSKLDFGTMPPRKLRWQPLEIENRNEPRELRVTPSASWITVIPDSLKCRPGERRRMVVRVNTSLLVADSGHEERASITITAGNSENSVSVSTRVESVSGIKTIQGLIINLVFGALLGVLILGGLGNLALMLLGQDPRRDLLVYGAGVTGFLTALVGLRIQDTLNLLLSLALGVPLCSLAGSLLGALIGLVISALNGSWIVFLSSTGFGLLVGAISGAVYICRTPARWNIWPF